MTRPQSLGTIALVVVLVATTAWADTQPDETGCYSHISKSTYPIGFKGFYKCKENECTDNGWKPTGVVDEECQISPLKEECIARVAVTSEDNSCWSEVAKKSYPVNHIVTGHKCAQYQCINNVFQDLGTKDQDCVAAGGDTENSGCWSHITKSLFPIGFTGPYNCMEFKCTEEGFKPTTGIKDPECEEKKTSEKGCYSDISKATYPIGFKGSYQCNVVYCTENDWQIADEKTTNCELATEDPGHGCWVGVTQEVYPEGHTSYHKCVEYKCVNRNFQPTGANQTNCTENFEKKTSCYSHISNENYPIGFIGSYRCQEVICTENDWQVTEKATADCEVATVDPGHGCWIEPIQEVRPEGNIIYHRCDELKCVNRNFEHTGAKKTNCTENFEKKTSCYSYISKQNYEIGFIGSYRCQEVLCTENDWQRTGETTADCELATVDPGHGCWIEPIQEVRSEDSIIYHKCEELKCVNRKFQPTGAKKTNCTEKFEKKTSCYSHISKENYDIGYIGSYRCQEVICSENDWKMTGETTADCEMVSVDPGHGCWIESIQEVRSEGSIMYHKCDELKCVNRKFQPTGAKKTNCSETKKVDENDTNIPRKMVTAALTSDAYNGSSGVTMLSVVGIIASIIVLVGAVAAVYVYVVKPKRLRAHGRDGPASNVRPTDLDNTSLQED